MSRLFLGVVWITAVLGCGPPPPAPKSYPPFKDVLLRIACPDEAAATLIAAGVPTWAGRNQARVETETYDPRKGPDIDRSADVWVIRAAEMPRWAATERLTSVPRTLASEDAGSGWTGLLPLYRDKLLVWDRAVYAFPFRGEAPICCYRSDLFGDETRRAAYEARYGRKLAPPRTWEEFADIGEFFQGDSAGFAHSLPPLPRDDVELDREFYAVAVCYARRAVSGDEAPGPDRADQMFALHYDLNSDRPRIDGPGFVHALTLLRRLRACRPDVASASPADAFRRGQAVLCLTDASRLADFQTGEGTRVRDRFGVCRTPAADCYFPSDGVECVPARDGNYIPYLGAGAWLGVVPKEAPHSAAAFSLLAELSGPEASDQLVIGAHFGGDPIRSEQLDERISWAGFEMKGNVVKELRETLQQTLLHRDVENPALPLRIPDEREHRIVLDAALRTALNSPNADPKKVLEEAARRWEEMDRAKGPIHRAHYRLSVGLLPE
jgi:multiple sugar transport system substrate-binding protein